MNWREPRLYFAAIAAVIGVCGQLSLPLFFSYGLGIEGVLVLKVVFMGFILSGVYRMAGAMDYGKRNLWFLVVMALTYLVFMAIGYLVYGAISTYPQVLLDFAIGLPVSSSLYAGMVLAAAAAELREARRRLDQRLTAASLVALTLVGLLWVMTEYLAYGILSEYLEPSEYYTVSQLSSEALLAGAVMAFFSLILVPRLERFMKGEKENGGGLTAG